MSKALWIIDTDAGVDDCQALVLAFSSPAIEVVGITTVSGNVPLSQVVKNTAEVLRVCEKTHIPYFIGSSRPLIAQHEFATLIHGNDGLNNYWETRTPTDLPAPAGKSAVEAIIDFSKTYSGNINILTIGPLTNLALAVAIDPELPSRFNRVLVMGAAVHAKGNRSITAEFNIYADPEAAYMVFERFPLLEVVPWETCIASEHQLSHEFLVEYTSGTSPIGQFIKNITKLDEGKSTVFFCDPLTMIVAIDPSIITKSTLREAYVELTGKHTRGMTVVNWKKSDEKHINNGKGPENLMIIEGIDMEKVQNLFLNSIR